MIPNWNNSIGIFTDIKATVHWNEILNLTLLFKFMIPVPVSRDSRDYRRESWRDNKCLLLQRLYSNIISHTSVPFSAMEAELESSKCDQCDERFVSNHGLICHTEAAHKVNLHVALLPPQCTHCGQSFLSEQDLNVHSRSAHAPKLYSSLPFHPESGFLIHTSISFLRAGDSCIIYFVITIHQCGYC